VTPLEIAANGVTTLSIVLAARNHPHTWTTGIVGCMLFAVLFFQSQLYAETTLQFFFAGTSVIGWQQWRHRDGDGAPSSRPITQVGGRTLVWMALLAILVTGAYGALLHHHTDAYLPYVDSAVLSLSIVAQCLLMQRKLQAWPFWLLVNTLSIPLFASRGLWLTSALYAAYWFNAWYAWWHWRKLLAMPSSQAYANP
jgi:nicotinamide mononucleotide transporter